MDTSANACHTVDDPVQERSGELQFLTRIPADQRCSVRERQLPALGKHELGEPGLVELDEPGAFAGEVTKLVTQQLDDVGRQLLVCVVHAATQPRNEHAASKQIRPRQGHLDRPSSARPHEPELLDRQRFTPFESPDARGVIDTLGHPRRHDLNAANLVGNE